MFDSARTECARVASVEGQDFVEAAKGWGCGAIYVAEGVQAEMKVRYMHSQ